MLGYAIFNINITNPESYKEYIEKVVKVTEKFGGKYIVRGGTTTKIEGSFPHPRTVVIQFPSYQKALEWYNSGEYKPIRKIRFKNAMSIGTIIEGA
ncbi:MAG: DUF1330 domain-containing protein [Candidatus Fonsibacter sp.]